MSDKEFSKEEIEQLIKEKQELLKEIEKGGKGSDYIKELSEIAFLQLELSQFEKSEQNFNVCIKHFKKQLDRLGQASVLGVLGVLNFKKGAYEASIVNYEKAYNIYKELNQVEEQITCLIGIGNSLIKLNQFEEASDTFLECSELCSNNDDIYHLLDCLGNLIQINDSMENWDVVFELYKKSLEAFRQLDDSKGMITSYFNLGILKKKSNKYDESLTYFKLGTNIAIDSNYTELILKGLSYIGEAYFYLGNMKEAKNEFIKALHIAQTINAQNAIIQLKILLNSIGLTQDNIDNELKTYREKSEKKP
ncbi:MAG: tetratricopeptide repeat protein [Promethearchaeota archaeon]|nr:MAG: tetratricopeptide repeat protein [Candidatus Lokiarchaeota archaeon]